MQNGPNVLLLYDHQILFRSSSKVDDSAKLNRNDNDRKITEWEVRTNNTIKTEMHIQNWKKGKKKTHFWSSAVTGMLWHAWMMHLSSTHTACETRTIDNVYYCMHLLCWRCGFPMLQRWWRGPPLQTHWRSTSLWVHWQWIWFLLWGCLCWCRFGCNNPGPMEKNGTPQIQIH